MADTGVSKKIDEEQQGIENEAKRAELRPVTVGGEEDVRYIPDVNRLATQIGLENDKIVDNKEKLKYLLEWAQYKTKSKDIVDMLYQVQELKKSMGFQEIGETALKKLYAYVRLSEEQSRLFSDLKRVKKEKELIKHGSTTQG